MRYQSKRKLSKKERLRSPIVFELNANQIMHLQRSFNDFWLRVAVEHSRPVTYSDLVTLCLVKPFYEKLTRKLLKMVVSGEARYKLKINPTDANWVYYALIHSLSTPTGNLLIMELGKHVVFRHTEINKPVAV